MIKSSVVTADDIIRSAHAAKKGGHSALYWHLWKNFLALETNLAHGVNWAAMAEILSTKVDGRGNAPSARTVRDTWRKVRRDRAGRRVRKKAKRRSRMARHFKRAHG